MKLPRSAKVEPLCALNLENGQHKKWGTAIFSSPIHETLQEAKENHDIVRARRQKLMASIVMDGKCRASWWNMLWCLVGTGLGMSAVFIGFVLWPTENIFSHPDQWYQCMLQCGIVWIGNHSTIILKII